MAAAFADAFPLSPGHCLIVPRRHEPDFFSLTIEEHTAVWALMRPARRRIESDHTPDGYNIGVNIGEAAGQTVFHAHVHVVPRYRGDVADPRGGVRWIIPLRAPYWKNAPFPEYEHLGRNLFPLLAEKRAGRRPTIAG